MCACFCVYVSVRGHVFSAFFSFTFDDETMNIEFNILRKLVRGSEDVFRLRFFPISFLLSTSRSRQSTLAIVFLAECRALSFYPSPSIQLCLYIALVLCHWKSHWWRPKNEEGQDKLYWNFANLKSVAWMERDLGTQKYAKVKMVWKKKFSIYTQRHKQTTEEREKEEKNGDATINFL